MPNSKDKGSKGKKSKIKYQIEARCSVGQAVTASTMPRGSRGLNVGPTQAKFQRKGAQSQSSPHRNLASSLATKRSIEKVDINKTACQKWSDDVFNVGLRALRKSFMDNVKSYTPEGTRNAFHDDANADKNRYDDVELLDKTRIKVVTNQEDDYIHASFVDIHQDMRVICTQGPLENTRHQFWIMIVEQSVKVILQLCQCMEDGKEKCADYVPLKIGGEMEFGQVKVKVLASCLAVGSMKKVTRTLIEVTYGDRIFETTHFLYAGWPDHTVPYSTETYKDLRSTILRIYNGSPIVSHCSAGVGRTGSFAAIEYAIYALVVKKDKDFSMSESVRKLRDQRMHAVQNDLQYAFIHRMVVEILLSEGHIERSSRLQKFFKDYDDLVERKRAELEKLKERRSTKK